MDIGMCSYGGGRSLTFYKFYKKFTVASTIYHSLNPGIQITENSLDSNLHLIFCIHMYGLENSRKTYCKLLFAQYSHIQIIKFVSHKMITVHKLRFLQAINKIFRNRIAKRKFQTFLAQVLAKLTSIYRISCYFQEFPQ